MYTGGSERLRITTGGQVLIGTSAADAYNVLQVSGAFGINSIQGFYSELNHNLKYTSGAWRNTYQGPSSQIVLDGGANSPSIIRFNVVTNDTNTAANTAVNIIEAMRINSAGNVGITSTNPVSKLHIVTTGAFNGSVNSRTALHIQSSNTTGSLSNSRIQFSFDPATPKSYIEAGTFGADYLSFGRGDGLAEAMRIDSSGNLLVGTTSIAPRDLTSGNGTKIPAPGNPIELATADANCMFINHTGSASGNATYIIFRQQGVNTRGTITTNGSTVSYNTSSDYRLKENIAPMVGALDTVSQLKPVTYTWKQTGKNSQGFIAHELKEVVPDCVSGEKDAVDKDGKPQYQGVDTSFLVATLTAAIQEQQAIIETLKSRLDAAGL
jgi:hypothetical protein